MWSIWVTWSYSISHVQLAILHGENLTLDIKHKLSTKFFHNCFGYRNHWLWPFYTTFSDLDLGWGHKGQHKTKDVGLFSCRFFQLNGVNFSMVMKQFNLRLFLSMILESRGKKVLFDCWKTFNMDILLGVYEPVWFSLDVIDTTEFYILIQVSITFMLLQGHGMQERKNICANCLPNLSVVWDGILHTVETSWSDDPYIGFISPDQYSKERSQLRWFHEICSIGLHLDIYRSISLKPCMTDTPNCIVWYQCEWSWPSSKVTVV